MKPRTNILNAPRFAARIQSARRLMERFPKKQGNYLHRSIATQALPHQVAKRQAQEYSLDANLFRIASSLDDFYQDSRTLDYLRHRYGNPHYMPPGEKDRFYNSKATIINFNDTLVEVIDSGASQFDFDQLLGFMTEIFSATHDDRQVADFHERAREAIVGMRNEMAVEQLLTAAGIEFRRGTAEEDSKGGDYFIENIPFDFKSNETSAQKARMRAEEGGYDGSAILWSHIHPEDFDGKLKLSRQKCVEILAQLKPELNAVITIRRHPHALHAI